MKLMRRIYSIYVILVFCITFFMLLPIFLIIVSRKSWHIASFYVNKFWAKVFFFLIMVPTKVTVSKQIDRSRLYIYSPNHASFLDIPTMCMAPTPMIFVGKSSIAKAPLFGYIYRKIHITVDRSSLRSRHDTHQRSLRAIDDGSGLAIFPEGGILGKQPPQMTTFKNGAFKAAIEKQIPIVPVTIPYNWIILPDDGQFLLSRKKRLEVIFHDPIETKGMDMKSLKMIKKQTFDTISTELKKHNTFLLNVGETESDITA